MTGLPSGWVALELGAIAARTSNIDPSRSPREEFELYSVPSYSEGTPEIVFGTLIKSSKQTVQENDVLLCKIVPHINRVWTVRPKNKRRQIASGEWIVYRNHQCDPLYLRNCLTEGGFRTEFLKTVSGVGGSLMRARPSEVAKIQVPIAPLNEQRRIVAKIGGLFAKSHRSRENIDHVPRLVEKYKQAILAAAYDGKLPGAVTPAHKLPISVMIASLDQGWSPKCESNPATDSEHWAVIKTTAIQPVLFNDGENKKLPYHLKPRPHLSINPEDILITRAGPRSRVAIACFVKHTRARLMLCDKAYRLRVKPSIADAQFLMFMLNAPQSLIALEHMKTGINDSGLNLTQSKFLELEIPAFSLFVQRSVARNIENAFLWIDRLAHEATSARKLIDHLDQAVLAKAFRGELVPQDPSNEPASALLARIEADRQGAAPAKRGPKGRKTSA